MVCVGGEQHAACLCEHAHSGAGRSAGVAVLWVACVHAMYACTQTKGCMHAYMPVSVVTSMSTYPHCRYWSFARVRGGRPALLKAAQEHRERVVRAAARRWREETRWRRAAGGAVAAAARRRGVRCLCAVVARWWLQVVRGRAEAMAGVAWQERVLLLSAWQVC